MTTTELEFLTELIRTHGPSLEEDTVALFIEYFHEVLKMRPYLTHTMKLVNLLSEMISENKERSVAIMGYVQQTLVPSVLTELLNIKKEEIELALKSPLSAHNVKKGRSPKKGSKGYKLLLGKENEL